MPWIWIIATYIILGLITWRYAGYHIAAKDRHGKPDWEDTLWGTFAGFLLAVVWPLLFVGLLVRSEPFIYKVRKDGRQ